jgi:diguanylate cyclase (GGDEF)-like protein
MDDNASSRFKDDILREQLRLTIKQVPTMQTASLIVALILCYTVRNIVPRNAIAVWLVLVLAVALGRVVLSVLFARVRDRGFSGPRWKHVYLLLTLVSGVIWGLSAYVIFPSGHTALIALFVLVMASLSAATTVSHAALKAGPAVWMMPVMILYAVRCIAEWREPENTIGILIIVYLVTLLRYSFTNHEVIRSAISLKFENLRLLEEVRQANLDLHRISTVDGLTGLANRRNFDDVLAREWRRAVREEKPLSAIMLDIDHFKAYNDNYGHLAGDDCLRNVASMIRAALKRPSDFAARYGGEEFVVVLPDTDRRGAAGVAERMRREIEAAGMPHAHSSASNVVTVSAGAATLVPQDGMTPSRLIALVDAALYAAKLGGRNQVKSSGAATNSS